MSLEGGTWVVYLGSQGKTVLYLVWGGGGLERDREGVSSSPRPTSRDDRDEDAQHLFPPREGVHLSSLSAGVSLGSLVPFSAFLTPESVSANQSSEFDLWSQ